MNFWKTTWQKAKASVSAFRAGFGQIIYYGLIIYFLIGFLIYPSFILLCKLLMKSAGFPSLSNFQIVEYMLSFQGVLTFVLFFLFALSVILIQFGGLTLISHQLYMKKPVPKISMIIKFCLSKFKNLLGYGGALIILYVFVFTPYIESVVFSSIFSNLDIPEFVQGYMSNNIFLLILLFLIKGTVFAYSFKWLFALHFIILEDKDGRTATKESWNLIKNNFKKFVTNLLQLFVIWSAFLIILFLFLYIIGIAYHFTTSNYVLYIAFRIAHLLMLAIISLILLPLQIYGITIIFYDLRSTPREPISDLSAAKQTTKPKTIGKVKLASIFFIFIFIIYGLVVNFLFFDRSNFRADVEITAHRGSVFKAPENTLTAIRTAIDSGADFVEIDVQQTKDGQFVLFHDQNLKRITGLKRLLGETTYEEIKLLDAGSWFDQRFSGERIPLLTEAIDAAQGKIKLNIEAKYNGSEPRKVFVRKLVEIIQEKNIVDSCVVTSFDYTLLQEIEKLCPAIDTGYIMFAAFGDLAELDVNFFSLEESIVNQDVIFDAHFHGKQVHVWTVNNLESVTRLINLGVDNIVTDRIKEVRDIIHKESQKTNLQRFIEKSFNNFII